MRTHYRLLLENEYLGQWDLSDRNGGYRKAVVEIESVAAFRPKIVRKKRLPNGAFEAERQKRLRISFAGKRKAWLAGPVSQVTIAEMYGPLIEDWIGKKITLYVDPDVTMGRKRVGGIRVENRSPKGPATQDDLDEPVEETKAEAIAEAFGDEQEKAE
jgi:hypothetical protein